MSKATTRKAKKRDVVDSIPTRSKEPFASIRNLLHSMDRHRIAVSIEIGKIVDALMRAEKNRGNATVIKLAKSLSVSPNQLFRLQWLVSRLSDKELNGLQELTMNNGRALTLSHLLLLAAADSAARRAELLALTLDGSLSARALSENIPQNLMARCVIDYLDEDNIESSMRELSDELCNAAGEAQNMSETLYHSASILEDMLCRRVEVDEAADQFDEMLE